MKHHFTQSLLRHILLAVPIALAPVASAQEAKKPASTTIDLKIVSVKRGIEVPRPPENEAQKAKTPGPFHLQGRQIQWVIEGRKLTDRTKLQKRLKELFAEPARRRPDPRQPGKLKPPAVVFDVQPGVCWNDVVTTMDNVLMAGNVDLRFGRWQRFLYIVPRSIVIPEKFGHTLIPPQAVFCEPDDQPPAFRPVVDIMQDGRILVGDSTVFDPTDKSGDSDKLKQSLLAFRAEAEKRKLVAVTPHGPRGKAVQAPLLIRADKWTDFRHVRRLIEACHHDDVLIWKLHLAVTDEDEEKRLFARQRRKQPQRK